MKVEYPLIEVEIDPIRATTREETFLIDEAGTRARAIRLERRSVPIDIVLVVNSSLAWIRNDIDEHDKRPLSGLELVHTVLASDTWREHAPSGSTITIVTYDSKTRVAMAPTQIGALPPRPLGDPENYNDASTSLAEGVRLGVEQLQPLTARRRLLVVIGDGFASDHDKDKVLLEQLAPVASSASIDVSALVYETWATERDPKAITSFVRTPTPITGVSDAVIALKKAVDDTVDAYSATFDGTSFDWDGEPHRLRLETADATLLATQVYLPEHGSGTPLSAWRWPLAALALVIAIVLARLLTRS